MKKLLFFIFLAGSLGASIIVTRSAFIPEKENFGVIDDSYEVNSLGSYNHIIPISIAPGVNGFQPKIALAYNSSGGQSSLGIGWGITGLSKITRTGNNYSQHDRSQGITFTGEDAFLIDGQFLTCVKGKNGKGGSEYRTESESFIKVFADEEMLVNSKSSPKKFIVKHPNGHTYYYGAREGKYFDNSRLIIQVSDNRKEILEWNVNRIEDENGNYIDFNYHNVGNSIRIQSISYTGNKNTGTIAGNKIAFNYNDDASELRKVNETYIAGNKFVNNSVLESISAETDGNDPFKFYHFNYDPTYSKLVEIVESSDENKIIHLLPTKIRYYQTDTFRFGNKSVKSIPYLNAENKNYTQSLIDMNQDGKKENVVLINSADGLALSIFEKDSAGFVTTPKKLKLDQRKYVVNASTGQNELVALAGIVDINGDGFPDIYTADAIWFYDKKSANPLPYIKQSNAFINDKKLIDITDATGVVMPNDFDGDGRTELALLNKKTGKHSLIKYNKESSKLEEAKVKQFNQKFARVLPANFRQGESRDLVFLEAGSTNTKRLYYKNGEYIFSAFTMPQGYKKEMISKLNFIDFNFDGLDDIYMQSGDASLPTSINKGSVSGAPEFTKLENITGPAKWSSKMILGNFVNGGHLECFIPTAKDKFEIYSFSVKNGKLVSKKENENIFQLKSPGSLDLTKSNAYGFTDFNGDGVTDFYVNEINNDPLKSTQNRFVNSRLFINKIASVIDGFKNGVKVNYTNIKTSDHYTHSGKTLVTDYNYHHNDFTVVKELVYTNGLKKKNKLSFEFNVPTDPKDTNYFQNYFRYDSLNRTEYFYEDLIYEIKGRGLAGFRKFSSIESHNKIKKELIYEYKFPLTGRIKEEYRYASNGVCFFAQKNEWDTKVYTKSVDFIEDKTNKWSENKENIDAKEYATSILKSWVKKKNISIYPIATNPSQEMKNENIIRGVKEFNKTGLRYLPYMAKTEVIKRELDGVVTSQSEIAFVYNRFGNILRKETTLGDSSRSISESSYTRIDQPNKAESVYRLGLIEKESTYNEKNAEQTASRSVEYTYDSKGKLLKKIREKGTEWELTTAFEYDDFGNVIQLDKYKDPSEKITEKFTYSDDGRFLISLENALNQKTKYTYDHRYGSVNTIKDANNNITVKLYDDFGQLVRIKYPDSRFETLQYGFIGKDENFFNTSSNALYKIVRSSPQSEDATIYFDKMGREVASIRTLMDTTKFRYISVPIPNLSRIYRTEPTEGKYTKRLVLEKNKYDHSGNLAIQFKPKYIHVSYDENDKIECVKLEDSLNYLTRFEYDDFDRIVKRINPDGTQVQVNYEGLKKTEISPGGLKNTTRYNHKSEPIEIINNANESVRYRYDLWGNVVSIINHEGFEIKTDYDKLGRKIKLIDPNIGQVNLEYDEFDRQIKETTNSSKIIKLQYDKLSRITQKEMDDKSVKWYYDSSYVGMAHRVSNWLNGKLISEEKSTYSNLGLLEKQTVSVDDSIYATTYQYDEYSRLTSKTHPNGYQINYHYINNLVSSISDAEKEVFSIKNLGAAGELNQLRYGNGITTERVFNKRNGLLTGIRTFSEKKYTRSLYIKQCPPVLTSILDDLIPDEPIYISPSINPLGPPLGGPVNPYNPLDPNDPFGPLGPYGPENRGTINGIASHLSTINLPGLSEIKKANEVTVENATQDLQRLSFSYNQDYNLVRKNDYVNISEESYKYDQLNRLLAYNKTTKTETTEVKLAYDVSGNITKKSDVGAYAYSESAFQRVQTIIKGFDFVHKYKYDDYGNVIEDEVEKLKLKYTSFNKPKEISKNGLKYSIEYGADNQQILLKKKRLGATFETRVKPFADYEVIKRKGETRTVNYILLNGQMIAVQNEVKKENESKKFKHYFHKDHLGNVHVVSGEDGKRVAEYEYDAFGKRKSTYGELATANKGFTGHEHLAEFGLIDAKGRYYNPSIGRFLSADPYIQAPDNLQSLNRYSYVLNNPVNLTDPSGYWNIGRSFRRAVRSVGRAIGNVGRTISKAVKDVVDVVVKAHEDVYAEADRFVNKYGKQLVIIAAAAAITYFSAGTLSGFGAAMLQGAAWGAGISASMTAIHGGSFQEILNAGFNGAIIGAAAGATAFTGAELSNSISYGKHLLGGVNGYASTGGSEEGFYRGVVASFIPADLGATATKSNAWALQLGSSAARGYVINGEEGMKNQVVGNALTQAVGHTAGLISSGGNGPEAFKDGVYLYNSKYGDSYSIGGTAVIGKGNWSNGALRDHEIKHFTEQNTLGSSYLIIHVPLAGVNAASDNKYAPLERHPYHSNPCGGGYCN